MNSLHIWLVMSFIITLTFWKVAMPKSNDSSITIGKFTPFLLFTLGLVFRVILAGSFLGFGADINCFAAWSDRMVELGPSGFYAKDYFSDYPPLYLYVLYLLGLIKKLFRLTTFSPVHLVVLKSPAILADLAIAYLIYRTCNRLVGIKSSLCLTCLFLFQPVVILNSCLWGQVDSVFTLFLLLVCLFLEKQNLLPAMLFFGLGVLLKPQMLIFTPVLLVGFIQYVFRGSFSLHMLTKALSYALLTLILVILIASPFGMENVLSQYLDTLTSYPYASVNAYNFWAGVGLNWHYQSTVFMGMPASTWGFIAIVLAAGLSIVLGLRLGNIHQKHALVGAFLIITVFTFSVRMHERYLYPILALLPLSFAGLCSRQLSSMPVSKREAGFSELLTWELRVFFPLVHVFLTGLHYFNCAHVLLYYDPSDFHSDAPVLLITGILMTLATLLFYLLLIRLVTGRVLDRMPSNSTIREAASPLRISGADMRLTRKDLLYLVFIMILYSVFAFRDLGDRTAPESLLSVEKGQTISLQFPEDQKVVSFFYYIAPEHNRTLLISTNVDNKSDWSSTVCTLDQVFTWQTRELSAPGSFVSMTPQSGRANIIELVFFNESGEIILPLNASDYSALFDEQELFPERISFRNSMYFDEIYHGRTAYEYLHGLRSYENTHPPLGKILISIGVLLFGMNPFGWRIVGTIFGLLMLPMLYLFAKRLTGDCASSALTTFIFAFDFMHFTQTRIATIDVYVVFFILCMYYFLFYFLTLDYGFTKVSNLCLPLGLCGISMGLGVACKWTGVYAGLGMGILFFGHLLLLYQRQKKAIQRGSADALKVFSKKTKKIIFFCILFFVLIPIGIYLASYLPFRDDTGHSLLRRAIDNQKTMYSYHSTLEATHYFSSPFYEWPLIIRPIWYYSGVLENGYREGISAFGNPLVWWIGLPALLYMIYLVIRKRDRRALFLVISYFAQYLPWFFVTRLTFIYHYFPSVLFLVLMIGYGLRNFKEAVPPKLYKGSILLYATLVFGLFLLFYPVLSGEPVELAFAVKYLKWFKTWILVSGTIF